MLNESYKKRIQKLAGIQINEKFDGGIVDTFGLPKSEKKTLAYNINQYKKIMGEDSIEKIINYLRKELKQPFVIENETGDKINFIKPEGYFLQFKGYLVDSSSYSFYIGHKNNVGEPVFDYQIFADVNNKSYSLKNLKF